jgi:hypothetical protein
MKRSFAFLCALPIFVLVACGSNSKGAGGTLTRVDVDNIVVPTVWTANNVYVIPDGATVNVSAALTIQPGTVVKLGQDSELYVHTGAQINAIGTAALPIVFTSLKDDLAGGDTNGDGPLSSPGGGDWSIIVVSGNQSTLSFCQFRYGDTGLQLNANNLTVSNNTFYANNTGLDASQPNLTGVSITGNLFYSNVVPVLTNSNYAVGSTNVFHYTQGAQSWSNTFQAIQVDGSIDVTTTWSNIEVAYTFNATGATIDINAALTLTPGVVVKLGQGDGWTLTAGATLNGFDTAIFTSLKDDSFLGDSNGDLAASTPGAGDWDGIADIRTPGPTLYLDGLNVYYAAN